MGFVLVLLTLFVVLNLINSRSGRAIMASRDNRIAAEAMGLNVTKYKLMAFVTSAALAGMAGALLWAELLLHRARTSSSLIRPSSCWCSSCWAASAISAVR